MWRLPWFASKVWNMFLTKQTWQAPSHDGSNPILACISSIFLIVFPREGCSRLSNYPLSFSCSFSKASLSPFGLLCSCFWWMLVLIPRIDLASPSDSTEQKYMPASSRLAFWIWYFPPLKVWLPFENLKPSLRHMILSVSVEPSFPKTWHWRTNGCPTDPTNEPLDGTWNMPRCIEAGSFHENILGLYSRGIWTNVPLHEGSEWLGSHPWAWFYKCNHRHLPVEHFQFGVWSQWASETEDYLCFELLQWRENRPLSSKSERTLASPKRKERYKWVFNAFIAPWKAKKASVEELFVLQDKKLFLRGSESLPFISHLGNGMCLCVLCSLTVCMYCTFWET